MMLPVHADAYSWTVAFTAWIGFCIASWLLHCYPTLLHSRKQRKGLSSSASSQKDSSSSSMDPRFLVKHIAHRGTRMEGIPENTLAAFKHAIESQADVIEFDVWLTHDGHVVIFHDGNLERMTGVKGCIADLTYDELPPILIKPEVHVGVNDKNRASASRIPLLSEVLELNTKLPMIIEFKQKSAALIEKVHKLLSEKGRKEDVMWFSLRQDINIMLRQYDSTIPNIASVAAMLKCIMLYYSGLLPFLFMEYDILGIPVDEVDYARVRGVDALQFLPDFVCRALVFFFGGKPPRALIPHGMFDHLRARGMPIFFLGVNDENDVKVAELAGATAVLTDRPSWLSERIKAGKCDLKELTL